MQSSNKAKLRLFAKHIVRKEAHKKPEKISRKGSRHWVRFLTLIPGSSDTAATVANLSSLAKDTGKDSYWQRVELYIRTPRLSPSVIPQPHAHNQSQTTEEKQSSYLEKYLFASPPNSHCSWQDF